MTPRPFRALRYDPARVELALVVGKDSVDPRHVQRLVDDVSEPADGAQATLRRARFRLAEWQRAGIVRRDAQPALYLVKRRVDDDVDTEALGLLCALPTDGADAREDSAASARLERGIAIEPVVVSFKDESGRVKRTLDGASDREADATWKEGNAQFELFVIDEESTTARVATLISAGGLQVERGAELLAAHAAWWKKQQRGDDDDGEPVAAAHALCFVHLSGDSWDSVPLGAAMLPLAGAL